MLTMLAALVLAADRAPSRADLALIERAARERLRDPDSAKFEWPNGFVRYVPANGVETWGTCGTVNARNGYGGYTGKVAILGTIHDGVAQVIMDNPAVGSNPVKRTCADIGVPVGN